MPRRNQRGYSVTYDATMSVSFKYILNEEEAGKKAAIIFIIEHVLSAMELVDWKVEVMDDDLDSNRKSIFVVDKRGLTFHYSVGQEKHTEKSRAESDEQVREKNTTIVFVWDKFDVQDHCTKYIGLIQKYTNSGKNSINKNVIVLLMPGADKVDIDFALSNSVPKARFLCFSKTEEFCDQLQQMILKRRRKPKTAWRYENAIKVPEYIASSNKRLKIKSDAEPSDFQQFSGLLASICSGVTDTKVGIRNNNQLLQEVLGKLGNLDKLPPDGAKSTASTDDAPDKELKLLFLKIVDRIRVRTRLFLRTLIPDDNIIDEVEQKYGGEVGREELNAEVLYRCLCYWAVCSTENGASQEDLERELNEALALSGNPDTKVPEMSQRLKRVLNVNREFLIDQICDPDLEDLCRHLQSEGDFEEKHKHYVLRRTTLTRTSQIDYLVDLLLTRGDSAYYNLLTFLTGQAGQEHVAQKLVDKETELASLDDGCHRIDFIIELPAVEGDHTSVNPRFYARAGTRPNMADKRKWRYKEV